MDTSTDSPLATIRANILLGLDNDDITLPILPKTAVEVLSIISDPNSQLEQLSTLIHDDQVLAVHVLKVANLTENSGGEAVTSLQDAIARLGMDMLASTAMAIALQKDTFKIVGFKEYLKNNMKHALLAGSWAREIARILKREAEGQFLCGLLHTIGQPAVVNSAVHFAVEQKLSIEFAEIKTLIEEFHIQMGAILTKNWDLPQVIQTATTYYTAYENAPEYKDETKITYLSEVMANWTMNRDTLMPKEVKKDEIFESLGLDEDTIEQLFERATAVQAMMRSLRIGG